MHQLLMHYLHLRRGVPGCLGGVVWNLDNWAEGGVKVGNPDTGAQISGCVPSGIPSDQFNRAGFLLNLLADDESFALQILQGHRKDLDTLPVSVHLSIKLGTGDSIRLFDVADEQVFHLRPEGIA